MLVLAMRPDIKIINVIVMGFFINGQLSYTHNIDYFIFVDFKKNIHQSKMLSFCAQQTNISFR